jgi:hypothetical protein
MFYCGWVKLLVPLRLKLLDIVSSLQQIVSVYTNEESEVLMRLVDQAHYSRKNPRETNSQLSVLQHFIRA